MWVGGAVLRGGGVLGGVLREVAGHLGGLQLAVGVIGPVAGADGLGVDLGAEDEQHWLDGRVRGGGDVGDGRGSGAGGVGQEFGGEAGGCGCSDALGGGAVEADECVEVDGAAGLHLGDLRELHGAHVVELRRGNAH